MTVTLYRKGKQKKVKGFMVDRLDCASDAVERALGKGWYISPSEAHKPVREDFVMPMPEPEPEPEYLPEPRAKRKRKK